MASTLPLCVCALSDAPPPARLAPPSTAPSLNGWFATPRPQLPANAPTPPAWARPQYCLNLSAPFICEVPPFKKTLMDLMPYVDYLFGNGAGRAKSRPFTLRNSMNTLAFDLGCFCFDEGLGPRQRRCCPARRAPLPGAHPSSAAGRPSSAQAAAGLAAQ